MRRATSEIGVVVLMCLAVARTVAAADAASAPAKEVSNFALLDVAGKLHELRRTDAKAVVLFFTSNGCPVARQSAPKLTRLASKFFDQGVEFWLVNANSADDLEAIAKETFELRLLHLPVLIDETQGVAAHLGVNRTGECVAISTSDWTVFYRGAIDDQLAEGTQKPAATERYLETALTEFLAGQPISRAKTTARGCLITFDGDQTPDATVSYARQVVPILQAGCIGCHSEGNVGSWAMTSYAKLKGMAAMIEEVILSRRMPPWDADNNVGKFQHSAALKTAEAQTLLRWVRQGAPRGDDPDPLPTIVTPPAAEWPLGKPDIILRLPKPEQIPATGVLEYRHIEVALDNDEELWVAGSWVKPGNKQVVHHVIAWLKEEGEKHVAEREHFGGYAPGSTQGYYPPGTGKLLPKKARFDIELHYTPNGTPQTDQTEIGLYLTAKQDLKPVDTLWIFDASFKIQPGDSESEHHAVYPFKQAATLYDLMPHMHLRGKWMKFELLRPDGKRKVLLSVPRYDFNWQRTYSLAEPLSIPAGSWLLISGGYDNSRHNPSNPNPQKIVRWGEQSFDEMFLGLANVTWDGASTAKTAGGE